jgi:hypothetical protein
MNRSGRQENSYSLPPAMTAAALKKLIEERNVRFRQAVDEFVISTIKTLYLTYLR